jgi:ectoine hydroxylase-related dioxygenase (phytanoyl-CoA dioxygenase family)
MNRGFVEAIERDGYAIVRDVIDGEAINLLVAEIENVSAGEAVRQRAGKPFGIRNLLNIVPSARALANDVRLRSLVEPVLGRRACVVRGIYLDKHRDANWKVIYHQDLTIAVRRQANVEGYGPWSMKAGIAHVQPPESFLENILTLRLHLDKADESNGALRVLPGSHKLGRLESRDIQMLKETRQTLICPVPKGGVMAMRPLLIHASSAASSPRHRRVLHVEYSSSDLTGGLAWYDG